MRLIRWSELPELQKDRLEAAKKEQMALMQACKLMCAASRKPNDGLQKEALRSDGLPLCRFCARMYSGSGLE